MRENRYPSSVLDYGPPEKVEPRGGVPLWIADAVASFAAGLGLFILWTRILNKSPATIFVAFPMMFLTGAIWATCRRSSAPPAGIAMATLLAIFWTLRAYHRAIGGP